MAEQSITRRLVPEQARGRIFGARGALNVAGYPLGGMLSGPLLSALGPQADFCTAAVLSLANDREAGADVRRPARAAKYAAGLQA